MGDLRRLMRAIFRAYIAASRDDRDCTRESPPAFRFPVRAMIPMMLARNAIGKGKRGIGQLRRSVADRPASRP
jgi:hypothetical protein